MIELANNNYQQLKEAIKQQNFLFLIIGKILKQIRDEKQYVDLGYEDFSDFLADPELKQKPSTSYAYIRVYEYYSEKLGLTEAEIIEVGIGRLQRLLPALKKKDDAEAKEIVTTVGAMTHLDYNQEVRERGLDIERPSLYRDNETGKWIIEYSEGTIQKIYNRTTNEVILEYVK